MPSNKKLLQAAAGNAGESLYVEDVFSTYLYAGTSATQNIINNIDLTTNDGLVWTKARDVAANHNLWTTEIGGTADILASDLISGAANSSVYGLSTREDGYAITSSQTQVNNSAYDYVSWTFRKAAGFFDVVTYTGDGGASKAISHSLGSTPGCIMVKNRDAADDWYVYHSGNTANPETDYLVLNTTAATVDSAGAWNDTAPTSTQFTVGTDDNVNASGEDYVAYIFAHDAQVFGDNGDESIIKCGSYTGTGTTNNEISLGWEPQYILIKNAVVARGWYLFDTMRGLATGGAFQRLSANDFSVEATGAANTIDVNADGFALHTSDIEYNRSGDTYIYIAIRRPMKVPEAGTEVFYPSAVTSAQGTEITTGWPVDLQLQAFNTANAFNHFNVNDRLRGVGTSTSGPNNYKLETSTTDAEAASGSGTLFWGNTGYQIPSLFNSVAGTFYNFKRAPEFMDVVCFDGVNGATAFDHGLTVVPEMMIVKKRSATSNWPVYHTGYPTPTTNQGALDLTGGSYANASFSTTPTSTQFTFNAFGTGTQVAYLFATLAGVSKVGSYTGTAASLDLDMGFAAGARFFLCKRTDSTGDWYAFDSSSGIVAGNDPYMLLNSAVNKVTGTDYVDPLAAGLTLTAAGSGTINISSATYIYLAIA